MTDARRIRDVAAALVTLAIGIGLLAWSSAYPPRLSAMPALVGWIIIVLALLDVASRFDTAAGHMLRRLVGVGAEDEKSEAANGWRTLLLSIGWPLAYLLVVIALGFHIATPIYVFLYMVLYGRKPLVVSAISAAVTTLAIWLTFDVLFRYPLFPGLIFGGNF